MSVREVGQPQVLHAQVITTVSKPGGAGKWSSGHWAAGVEAAGEGADAAEDAGAVAADAAGAGTPGFGSELVNGSVELMIWGKVARSAAPGSREI
jgi:hypothetical protein